MFLQFNQLRVGEEIPCEGKLSIPPYPVQLPRFVPTLSQQSGLYHWPTSKLQVPPNDTNTVLCQDGCPNLWISAFNRRCQLPQDGCLEPIIKEKNLQAGKKLQLTPAYKPSIVKKQVLWAVQKQAAQVEPILWIWGWIAQYLQLHRSAKACFKK